MWIASGLCGECGLPAHLVEEAVGAGHPVELVLVLLQQIHVALLWYKLQQLQPKTVDVEDGEAFGTSSAGRWVSPAPACPLPAPPARPSPGWPS